MKVLLTTHPGFGHLNPMIPVARALERAGHEALFACSASFIPYVEAAHLRAVPAGLDWLETLPELIFPEVARMTPQQRELFLTDIFADSTALPMAQDLMKLFETWRPDVVLRDFWEYGACAVAERFEIPHAALDMEFFTPDHITRKGLDQPLAYLRSVCGLPPHPTMEMLHRYLYLGCVPPSYQFPDYRLPPVAHALKPACLEPNPGDVLPAWLGHLPDRPTIYASMGTTFNKVPEIFKLLIAGLGNQPVNVIITVGHSQDPHQFDPLPDNVYIEHYIPQAALMPYCDVAITNGGVGTDMIALTHGVPLLIIPLGGHLMLHALRCRSLGVGLSLKLPPDIFQVDDDDFGLPDNHIARQARAMASDNVPELSAESIRATVQTLLEEPAYRQAAQRLQAEIRSLPGPDYAVKLLERLAVERAPILSEPRESVE